MKLYTFPPSPNARKVAAVIAHLCTPEVEHALVRLHKGEHRPPIISPSILWARCRPCVTAT
jgi:glutathione S-transferase